MTKGTKSNRGAAAAILAAFLASTGCYGSNGDGAIPLDQLWRRWIEVQCSMVHRCPYAEGVGVIPPAYAGSSAAECVSIINTVFAMEGEDPMWELHDAVDRGTVRYDGNAARACIDYAAGMSCDQLQEEPAECERVFVGTVSPGGQCMEGEECLGGWCDTGAACPGRCVAYRRAGESCTGSTDRCEPNTDCDDSGRCATETSRQYAGEGQTCDDVFGPRCSYGLECGDTGTCVRLPPIRSEGQSCGDATGFCNPGLACHEGTCRRPPATVGAACHAETLPCTLARNLICDPSTARCVAIPGAGEPCVMGFVCGGGTFCGDDRTCRARLADGAPCTGDIQCSSLNCTDAGACGPRDPCEDEPPSI